MTTRPTVREGVGDALVMARRDLIATVRVPTVLVFAFVQPVMFVLLFRYVFGGAIQTPNGSYVNFLMPGILVQTAIFGALMTGIGLNDAVAKGIVDRLRSLPMARSAVVVGRTLSDLLRNLATLAVMLGVGVAVGFRPSGSVAGFAAAVALLLAFSYVFSWVSATIGLSVKDPETAQSAGFVWVFPLTFASSAFVPTDTMPDVIRWFADVNPVTLCVDAVRGLMLGGGGAAADVGWTLAWAVGLLVIFVPLAVRQFRALR